MSRVEPKNVWFKTLDKFGGLWEPIEKGAVLCDALSCRGPRAAWEEGLGLTNEWQTSPLSAPENWLPH